MRARNGWGWLSPVQLNDGTTGYCDLNAHYYVSSAKKDYPTVRPMSEQENAEWWNYKVVWASGLNLRSFADSNATGTVIMKIPKAATVELDLNHTMREPKYGDTWAFARYKQADGSYVYGWCIESDSNYMQKQDKIGNSAHYSDYIIDEMVELSCMLRRIMRIKSTSLPVPTACSR